MGQPSMCTTDQNLRSDRPAYERIRTLEHCPVEVNEWTDSNDGQSVRGGLVYTTVLNLRFGAFWNLKV